MPRDEVGEDEVHHRLQLQGDEHRDAEIGIARARRLAADGIAEPADRLAGEVAPFRVEQSADEFQSERCRDFRDRDADIIHCEQVERALDRKADDHHARKHRQFVGETGHIEESLHHPLELGVGSGLAKRDREQRQDAGDAETFGDGRDEQADENRYLPDRLGRAEDAQNGEAARAVLGRFRGRLHRVPWVGAPAFAAGSGAVGQ